MTFEASFLVEIVPKKGKRARVSDLNGFEEVKAAMNEGKRVLLKEVKCGERQSLLLQEEWTQDSMSEYIDGCVKYGESFFLFCETMKTRNCLSKYVEFNRGIFESMAEAGKLIAEQFLGLKQGVISYLDAKRLANDVLNNAEPNDLRQILRANNVEIRLGPDGHPIFVLGNAEAERPESDEMEEIEDDEIPFVSSPSMGIK